MNKIKLEAWKGKRYSERACAEREEKSQPRIELRKLPTLKRLG